MWKIHIIITFFSKSANVETKPDYRQRKDLKWTINGHDADQQQTDTIPKVYSAGYVVNNDAFS